MLCPICGKENPDDATYCKHCGKRMDGKKQCRFCGKLIDADAGFCNYCGTPAGAVNAAPLPPYGMPPYPYAASPVYTPPAYAPQPPVPTAVPYPAAPAPAPYAAPAAPVRPAPPSPAEQQARSEHRKAVLQKVMRYCSQSFSLAMAVFSLIFVFLVGVAAYANLSGVQASAGVDIYYYFGGIYADIGTTLAGMSEYSGIYASSLYFQAIPLTVISAIALLGVAALSVAGIVIDILRLAGKRKDGKSVSVFAFLLYFSFVLAFYALNNVHLDVSIPGVISGGVAMAPNGATLAGICLGAIFFDLFTACRIVANVRKLFKENLLNTILSYVGVPLSLTLMSISTIPLIGIFADTLNIGSVSPIFAISLIGNLCTTEASVQTFGAGNAAGAIAMLTIICFLLTAVIAFAALCLRKSWLAALEPKKNGALKWSILLTSFAAALLVCYIVADSLTKSGIVALGGDPASISFTYTMPVLLLVFSVLLLVMNIVRKGFAGKKEAQEGARQTAAQYAYAVPYGMPYGAAQQMPAAEFAVAQAAQSEPQAAFPAEAAAPSEQSALTEPTAPTEPTAVAAAAAESLPADEQAAPADAQESAETPPEQPE